LGFEVVPQAANSYERQQAADQGSQHPPTAYGETRDDGEGEEAELGRFILGAGEQIQRFLIRERPEAENDRVDDGQIYPEPYFL
jgi:hypothetical protein